jgi:hypothetical protein
MSGFVINPNSNNSSKIYDLCSIINHLGQSLSLGHYTAYARTHDKTNTKADEIGWRMFDDQHVMYVNENQIVSKNAYVLMYRLRSSEISDDSKLNDDSEASVPIPNEEVILNNYVDENENGSSVAPSEDEYFDIDTDESEEIKDSDEECDEDDEKCEQNENTITASNNFIYTQNKHQSQKVQQNPPLNLQIYTNLNDLD